MLRKKCRPGMVLAMLCLFVLVWYCVPVRAQSFKIGDRFPYAKLGFKPPVGKVAIIDYFSSGCKACFAVLPKLRDLQHSKADSVQFYVVGYDDGRLQTTYTRFEKALGLTFPVAYDSVMIRQAKFETFPLYLWVDAGGFIRAQTGPSALSEENLRRFYGGRMPVLAAAKRVDPNYPYLMGKEEASDERILLRSVFAKWEPGEGRWLPFDFSLNKEGLFQVVGGSVEYLYLLAFGGFRSLPPTDSLYGKFYARVIWEPGSRVLATDSMSRYSYSIRVPAEISPKVAQQMMQRDLLNLFPYRVAVEEREMEVYEIVIPDGDTAHFTTKSKIVSSLVTHAKISSRKVPWKNIYQVLASYYYDGTVILDGTNLRGAVDIDLNGAFAVIGSLRDALRAAGMDLVKLKRKMKVVVVYREAKL